MFLVELTLNRAALFHLMSRPKITNQPSDPTAEAEGLSHKFMAHLADQIQHCSHTSASSQPRLSLQRHQDHTHQSVPPTRPALLSSLAERIYLQTQLLRATKAFLLREGVWPSLQGKVLPACAPTEPLSSKLSPSSSNISLKANLIV